MNVLSQISLVLSILIGVGMLVGLVLGAIYLLRRPRSPLKVLGAVMCVLLFLLQTVQGIALAWHMIYFMRGAAAANDETEVIVEPVQE